MNFLERINNILEYYDFSRAELARKLEIQQPTFNRYFKETQQDKFIPHLWSISEIFPDISKNWLFFGEGEMFDTNGINTLYKNELLLKIKELEQELKEEQKLNRKLTNKLLELDNQKELGKQSS